MLPCMVRPPSPHPYPPGPPTQSCLGTPLPCPACSFPLGARNRLAGPPLGGLTCEPLTAASLAVMPTGWAGSPAQSQLLTQPPIGALPCASLRPRLPPLGCQPGQGEGRQRPERAVQARGQVWRSLELRSALSSQTSNHVTRMPTTNVPGGWVWPRRETGGIRLQRSPAPGAQNRPQGAPTLAPSLPRLQQNRGQTDGGTEGSGEPLPGLWVIRTSVRPTVPPTSARQPPGTEDSGKQPSSGLLQPGNHRLRTPSPQPSRLLITQQDWPQPTATASTCHGSPLYTPKLQSPWPILEA